MSMTAENGAALAADEAERRVLGILLKHPETADTVLDRCKSNFHDPVYRRIFQFIGQIYSERGRISYTQVYNLCAKRWMRPNKCSVALWKLHPSY